MMSERILIPLNTTKCPREGCTLTGVLVTMVKSDMPPYEYFLVIYECPICLGDIQDHFTQDVKGEIERIYLQRVATK